MLALAGPGAALAAAASSFSYTPDVPLKGSDVAFMATDVPADATAVHWDFGDGTEGSGANVSHPYASAGSKTVTLTVEDPVNGTTTATRAVRVNAAPVATFGWSPSVPQIGDTVAFDASGSNDPDGGAVSYAWDFGDGQLGSGASPQHVYSASGSYTVTLSVTDADGVTTSATRALRVNAAPAAHFTFAALDRFLGQPFDVPILGQSVAFDGSSSTDTDGTVAAYAWDFNGDGVFGDDNRASLVTALATAGNVTIGLRVTDSDGATNVFTRPVRVDQLPIASFTFTPTAPAAGQRTSFESSSSDPDGAADITGLQWDLDGDGAYGDASGPTATRVFGMAGTYPVALQATDSVGVRVVELQHVSVRIAGSPSASGSAFSSTFVGTPLGGASGGTNGSPKVTVAGKKTKLTVAGVRVAIAGRVFQGATRITRLVVNGPSGAQVSVRCRGQGCPATIKRLRVPRGVHSVRVRALERMLAAGTRVFVSVTKSGFIGKQIQFTIRRTQPPVRRELCLVPGKPRAVQCAKS
jgi:PKD repeat protein